MSVDVVVVGLGTAGAAVAAFCAQAGLSVLGLERRPLEHAGARWVNGVPAWAFDEARLKRPQGEELRATDPRYHLIAGWDGPRVKVHGALNVDMRHLVSRLQGMATAAGATLSPDTRVVRFDGRQIHTKDGPIDARYVVDASGIPGIRLLRQIPVAPGDLCAAAQQVHALADPEAAARYFADHGAEPGDTLCFTSVAGGYSIVNVRLENGEVDILTGSVPAAGVPAGQVLLDRFVEEHPWIGEKRFGGARAIPLRRPEPKVGRSFLALVGDAACQVHAGHGSGIAMQLVAARMLADALTDGSGPEGYNVAWQRRWGGMLASADLFRRFSQTLSVADLSRLFGEGILAKGMVIDVMQQRPPRLRPAEVLQSGRALARHPDLARRLLPVLVRMKRVERLYARYPASVDELPDWRRRLVRLTGLKH